MQENSEKYIESLSRSLANLNIADHILYITYPLFKEKKLLLKALEEIYNSLLNLINSILQYDYVWKRIQLYKDPKQNFETFKNKCSKRYNLSDQELSKIDEIIAIFESHKRSPIEFLRQDKVIIMSDNLKTRTIDIILLKSYLTFIKSILFRVRSIIKPL